MHDFRGNWLVEPDTTGMIFPVLCNRCPSRKAYDLADVQTVHRYADCTVFKTPCCGRQVDDRQWVSLPAFRRLY